jgi:two-component system sensor histidine kinase KdpD
VRRETEDPKAILFRIQHPSDERFEGEEFWDWTLYGGEGPLGVIRIPWEDMGTMDQDRKRLLHSMIDSIALAMDRFRAAEQRIKSREEVSRERYRANLLRSISHDIRTPLAGIIGCSEILRDSLDSAEEPYRIAGRIQKDAEWLHSLVENIMGLTRLQDGGVKLKKEWEAVEEIIGGAVAHVEQHWTDREIDVRLPEKVLMAPMDAKLIEQVNINLLENAMKHSRDSGPVMITASEDKATHSVVVTVRDSGEGIRSQDLPHIFQPFYTSGRSESTKERSFGLGLAICETIVHAHGGTIQARNRADGGGAEFTYTIPMEVHDDKENRKDTGR